MTKPCATDHGGLSDNYCPSCGVSVRPMREPGEVRAEYARFNTAVRARRPAPRSGGLGDVVFILAVTQTLAWILNQDGNEAPTDILIEMTEPARR